MAGFFDRFRRRPENAGQVQGGTIGGRNAIPQRPDLIRTIPEPQTAQMMPALNQEETYGGAAPARPAAPEKTGEIDRIMRGGDPDVEAARKEGERIGAEAAMMDAGIRPLRIRRLQEENRIMNRARLNTATRILLKYKAGKASVNRRVVQAQQWWKLNNWEEQDRERGTKGATVHKSNTGWLWNCIVGKHADAIDSYPEPIILPRAEDDKQEAQKLSKIVPVVMEINGFEEVYNQCCWQKMQEGTGVYGIFWDPGKLGGMGDIAIRQINLLNLYWEPGISDIQESKNVFYVHYEDTDELVEQYPELAGEMTGTSPLSIDKYKTDDSVDTTGKSLVIDWYYRKRAEDGMPELHYCQYVNETVLYSTEENGTGSLYNHGLYPFVLDPLFPVAGSPAGYGYIDIGKDAQMDIDTLSQAMVKNMEASATPRFFIRKDGSINEEEFSDFSKPFVHCGGMLGEDSIRQVMVNAIGGNAMSMLQQKIDELKFITGNTDVNNGGVPNGVTAASAIAALKEDSGRSSKDSTKAAYRAYRKIVSMVIELIRQFYDIPRQFRIVGQDGNEEFTSYDNTGIAPVQVMNGFGVPEAMRMPVFDIEIRAQRENAYTKMSQNELAIQMYQMGVFNPQMTDQALIMLDTMDFRGKEELRRKLQQAGGMADALAQVGQIAMALAEKYEPAVAAQLGAVLQGVMADSGMALPAGGGAEGQSDLTSAPGDNTEAPNPNENQIVQRARERAANATRPS